MRSAHQDRKSIGDKKMKTMMKLALAMSLFCSMTLADDGDMGSGGYCGVNCPPPPCQVGCFAGNTTEKVKTTDWIFAFVKGYIVLGI
jgi:hypothetical protein